MLSTVSLFPVIGVVAAFDCSANVCQSGCECAVANCGAEIDACSADPACAAGQDCYAGCACGDTDCVVACATAYPSAENGPYFDCMNANCAGSALPLAPAKAAPLGIDCSTDACQSGCECALANCAAEIDACSADPACAAGQACYSACACGDTDCVVACATAYPSAENGPYFDCMNANCAGSAFPLAPARAAPLGIDCSTDACQSGCECAVANCAAEIDACSADPACAAGQACYSACACGDTDCVVACATAYPSAENGPYFDCMNANCAGSAFPFAPAKTAPLGIDCSTDACQPGCECALANCAAEIDACSADPACAAGQACYSACACGDTDCVVACATAYPSAENGPYFDCMNANCAGSAFPLAPAKAAPLGIDCSTDACQSGCECALANCAAEIDACSADPACAAGQACYSACACGDTDCVVACATAYPSAENGPYFDCMNANCAGRHETTV